MLAATELRTPSFRSSATGVVEERRGSSRLACRLPLRVCGPACGGNVPCTVRDVNECGLFLLMPAGHGLSLGDRCELVVCDATEAPELCNWVGVPVYATVIRTERRVDAAQLGVGLRFDQPLIF